MKKCRKCGEDKELKDFYLARPTYRDCTCKKCRYTYVLKNNGSTGRFEKGQKAWNKGVKLNKDQRKNMGRPVGAKHTEETKRKMSLTRRGKGASRLSWNSKEWRRKVFKRDNYICVECGAIEKQNLNSHHIIPWKDNDKLRFEVDNGMTLCKSCHGKKEGFQKGNVPWSKDKKFSKEHRKNLSEGHKKRGLNGNK